MTIILDGKALSDKIKNELAEKIKKSGLKPKLAVIMIGNNPASLLYVSNKQKAAKETGIDTIVIPFADDISEINLIEQIHILDEDENINAILVQLPIPNHLNKQRILEAINPFKDVDGFTSYNAGSYFLGYRPFAYPCTPKGILRLIDEYKLDIDGENILVIGRSNIVGKPLQVLLEQRNATVTLANSHTKNLSDLTKQFKFIVSAVGKPKFITGDMVQDGVIIIDVGINKLDGKTVGDVDFETVSQKAKYITPVPKGVGPMTIAMLLENTYELALLQQSLKNEYMRK